MRKKCAVCEKFMPNANWFVCDHCYTEHDVLDIVKYVLRDLLETDLTPSFMFIALGLALLALLTGIMNLWYGAFLFVILGIASYGLHHSPRAL
tara:strand:+ start:86 stop:364 length:279 start_codon:yes stop_codon:yes gene_type:complete